MSVQQLPGLAVRVSLVLAPLLWLVSAPLAAGAMTSSDAAGVAEIARHPDRYYQFTLLTLIGTMLLVPALVGLTNVARERAPLAAFVGAALVQLGALVGIADSGTQLVYWQTPGGNPAQMAALLHRYENATGAGLVFMVGGLSLMVGGVVLATALVRSRALPVWAAVCIPLGLVSNVVAFAAHSEALLTASSAILLAGFARAALRSAPVGAPAVASAV